MKFQQVNVIDTVGCGDSFVAAIAFGYIHNMPLVYTLAIANAVGAATAMGCGAGRSVATLDRVTELIRESNLNEDNEYWNECFDGHLDENEIMILSKTTAVNGGAINQLNRVSMQKVVSEVLSKLKSPRVNEIVQT